MIVDKQLVVSNRKKSDIIQDLRKHDFRPFPKVSSAKKGDKGADVQDEEDDEEEDEDDEDDKASSVHTKGKGKGKTEGDSTDYDYLLGMAIWSLTKEKISKLNDLDLFLAEWDTNCKEWVDASTAGKKGKKKQAVLKTRKSIGNRARSDSDDDDFRPTKAPAKRKPVAESSRSKPVAKKSAKNEDEDVDMEEAPVKKPVAPRRKVAEKKAIKIDSDDGDEYLKPTAAAKGKGRAVPVTKRKRSARPIINCTTTLHTQDNL
ncbi:hypothetical protein H0H87_004289 [Tephrocybe sp. NHM501043]|nr:hypothetical protein H0H87_004289 [Tephrocybe sp. NHM501043]